MIATLASIVWKGDKLSKIKSKNGEYINSIKNNHWDKFFTYKEQLLLNELYKDYKRFNYNFINLSWKQKILIFFLIFFPMSFEKLTFKSNNANLKIKFSNYKYFIKRVIYLLLTIIKSNLFNKKK